MYSPAVLTETPEAITITNVSPKWFRILIFCFALIPVLGVYEMLLKPRWNWSAFTLDNPAAFAIAAIPVIIAIGCMSLIATLIGASIFGPDTTYVFDKKRQMLFYTESKRPLNPGLKLDIPFRDLPPIEVVEDNDSDGPTRWEVTIRMSHHKSTHMLYYYTAEQPARELRDRLTAV